jgi:hypothetical protein
MAGFIGGGPVTHADFFTIAGKIKINLCYVLVVLIILKKL